MNEVPLSLSCSPAPRAWHIYIEVVIDFLTITYRHTSLFEKEYLLIYRACVLTWHKKNDSPADLRVCRASSIILDYIGRPYSMSLLYFDCRDQVLS